MVREPAPLEPRPVAVHKAPLLKAPVQVERHDHVERREARERAYRVVKAAGLDAHLPL